MSRLDQNFATAARGPLLYYAGESVTYAPKEGTARTVTAMVHRDPGTTIPGVEAGIAPHLVVEVCDDPTDANYGGIDPLALKLNADKLHLPRTKGGTVEELTPREILGHQGGLLRLRVS